MDNAASFRNWLAYIFGKASNSQSLLTFEKGGLMADVKKFPKRPKKPDPPPEPPASHQYPLRSFQEKRIDSIAYRCSDTFKNELVKHAQRLGVSLSELQVMIGMGFLIEQAALCQTVSDSPIVRALEEALKRLRLHLGAGLTLYTKASIQHYLSKANWKIWEDAA